VSLRGFSTISFWADDVAAAAAWYARFLDVEAYFTRPGPDGRLAYAEFRIGDYQAELGIIDRSYGPPGSAVGPGGAIMYWHVDDLAATGGAAAVDGSHGVPADHTARGGVRHRRRGRPGRQRAGRHVQPALP
jgi:predicted enzyme related to lactoylglutathione lyase